jgi:hypothetical protein
VPLQESLSATAAHEPGSIIVFLISSQVERACFGGRAGGHPGGFCHSPLRRVAIYRRHPLDLALTGATSQAGSESSPANAISRR